MLKDIQGTLHLELQNPDVQREFILAYAEEEGLEGVLKALGRIAEANRSLTSATTTRRRVFASRSAFNTVRRRLNAVGLDFQVTAMFAARKNGRRSVGHSTITARGTKR